MGTFTSKIEQYRGMSDIDLQDEIDGLAPNGDLWTIAVHELEKRRSVRLHRQTQAVAWIAVVLSAIAIIVEIIVASK
jgi:hypothetical protein